MPWLTCLKLSWTRNQVIHARSANNVKKYFQLSFLKLLRSERDISVEASLRTHS